MRKPQTRVRSGIYKVRRRGKTSAGWGVFSVSKNRVTGLWKLSKIYSFYYSEGDRPDAVTGWYQEGSGGDGAHLKEKLRRASRGGGRGQESLGVGVTFSIF